MPPSEVVQHHCTFETAMNQTNPKVAVVKCPKCGRAQPKTLSADGIYWCNHCKMQHDDDPDEGGTFSSFDPSARIEREERNQARKQQQRQR